MPDTAKDFVKDLVQTGYATLACLNLKEISEMALAYKELIQILTNILKHDAIQNETNLIRKGRFVIYYLTCLKKLD